MYVQIFITLGFHISDTQLGDLSTAPNVATP